MKKSLVSLILVISLNAHAKLRSHDPAYGDCSFACKEIPVASEVMRRLGQNKFTQLHSSRLQILSWNIYKGGQTGFTNDFQRLTANKDIVLLSEVITADPVAKSMTSVTGFAWDIAVSFLMKKQIGTGTAVGSYATNLSPGFYRTKDVEPFVKSPKTTAKAEYLLPNSTKKILVLSIHGINWSGDDSLVRQLQMTIEDIKKHDGPVVFAGDFNIKNSTRLQVAIDILATAGLERVAWDNPENGDQRNDAFTRGVVVHRAELINDVIDSGSDHPAIVLDIEWIQ